MVTWVRNEGFTMADKVWVLGQEGAEAAVSQVGLLHRAHVTLRNAPLPIHPCGCIHACTASQQHVLRARASQLVTAQVNPRGPRPALVYLIANTGLQPLFPLLSSPKPHGARPNRLCTVRASSRPGLASITNPLPPHLKCLFCIHRPPPPPSPQHNSSPWLCGTPPLRQLYWNAALHVAMAGHFYPVSPPPPHRGCAVLGLYVCVDGVDGAVGRPAAAAKALAGGDHEVGVEGAGGAVVHACVWGSGGVRVNRCTQWCGRTRLFVLRWGGGGQGDKVHTTHE